MKFPLLLENTGEIRVSHSKLWVNFQCFEVKTDGFFSVTLLSFNVGKIVERIRVIRSQGQGSVVAIFSFLYLQIFINSFKLNGIAYPLQLDEPISKFRDVRLYFSLFIFL